MHCQRKRGNASAVPLPEPRQCHGDQWFGQSRVAIILYIRASFEENIDRGDSEGDIDANQCHGKQAIRQRIYRHRYAGLHIVPTATLAITKQLTDPLNEDHMASCRQMQISPIKYLQRWL
jgi:hypothetical protein